MSIQPARVIREYPASRPGPGRRPGGKPGTL